MNIIWYVVVISMVALQGAVAEEDSDIVAIEKNITYYKSRVRSLYLVEKYFSILFVDGTIR